MKQKAVMCVRRGDKEECGGEGWLYTWKVGWKKADEDEERRCRWW